MTRRLQRIVGVRKQKARDVQKDHVHCLQESWQWTQCQVRTVEATVSLLHSFLSFQCSCILGCQSIPSTSMMWDPQLAVAMSCFPPKILPQFPESLLTSSSRNAYTGYPFKRKLRGRNQLCALFIGNIKDMPFIFHPKFFLHLVIQMYR